MYHYLLIAHSLMRWLVVIALVYGLLFIIIQKRKQTFYTAKHYKLFTIIKNIVNIQFILGIWLLFKSPFVHTFWQQVSSAVKWRDVRFFGLEHPFMMLLGILLLNYFTHKTKQKINTTNAFGYLLVSYIVVFLIIFLSIPWSFSPFTARPNFRFF